MDVTGPDGKLIPHEWWPDTEAMGDCVECGHVEDAPIHQIQVEAQSSGDDGVVGSCPIISPEYDFGMPWLLGETDPDR